MARVTSAQGQVEIRWSEAEPWRDARFDDILCAGTTVRVGTYSRAALVFADDSTLRLDQSTTLVIRGREEERRTWLDMITGAIHFFSHRPRSLNVETPFVNAAAEGTEFLIRVTEERAHILMFEGIVLASNESGKLRLGPDDAALIRKGEKPVPEIVIRPRDAVAWAVHAPDVFSDLAGGAEPGAYPVHLQVALKWARENNIPVALRTLDLVQPEERDASHEALRAGIFLTVGRIREAEAAIERALALDAEASDAYAVGTIIHIIRNERAQASRDADRAVKLAPTSSTALIAQSYARQSSFDLDGARDSLREAVQKNPREAVQKNPNDALAYARLAEIELSFGDHERANEAADQASSLAPNLARTQTVLGFSKLAEIDTDAARKAFARAIALQSADPLPHLGFGLANIRDGFLEAGRRDLEIAASLDPNNALIRSYLGKAYFEEKRGPKDATQFNIAKKFDPNDPTPWFYDAIRKQTENRPVEALRDLEKAIELNDNRAVYRSSLLLDQDLAARGSSLARIYNDLGFEQPAINEATTSLTHDPSNHSAHLFLSDAYAQRRGHEIARVSELLQAQLLQPINYRPVQPSSLIIDRDATINASTGQVSFNDYDSLFERNRLSLDAAGVAGSNNALGDELVASGLWDKWSFSLGQSYQKTDGFRANNSSEFNVYSAFSQYAVTPKLSVQAEYRRNEKEQGDIVFAFERDNFNPDVRRNFDDETIRVGFRYAPSPNLDVLGSAFFSRLEESSPFPPPIPPAELEDEGYQAEIQTIYRDNKSSLIAGLGRYDIDVEDSFFGFSFNFDREQNNAYTYFNSEFFEGLQSTIGLSVDSFQEDDLEVFSINPKIGSTYRWSDQLQIRAAAFKAVKRALVVEQTIEPTQVAGFNQFFDDFNGTESWRYGLGVDIRPKDDIYGGIELSIRDLEQKVFNEAGPVDVERSEVLLRLYSHFIANKNWVFSAEFNTEYVNEKNPESFIDSVTTVSLPIGMKHYAENGLIFQFSSNFLYQEQSLVDAASTQSETTVLFDTALGYRLPDRLGIFNLEARNLLGTKFNFRDDNFRRSEDVRSQLVPERTILATLTIKF